MRRLGWLFCGLVFIGGGLLCLYLVAPGWFNPWSWGRGNADYGYVWGWSAPFGFPIMGLVMFAFCVVMMGGMLLHGQRHGHGWSGGSLPWQGESNLDILQRRYSRGEITQGQFEEMKRELDL